MSVGPAQHLEPFRSRGGTIKASVCRVHVITERNYVQCKTRDIEQRRIRLRCIPIDEPNELSAMPDGIPRAKVPMTDDFTRLQSTWADSPNRVGWSEAGDGYVEPPSELRQDDNTLLSKDRRRPRAHPRDAFDEGNHLSTCVVYAKWLRGVFEACGSQVTQQRLDSRRPRASWLPDGIAYANRSDHASLKRLVDFAHRRCFLSGEDVAHSRRMKPGHRESSRLAALGRASSA